MYQWLDGQVLPSGWQVHQRPVVSEDVGHRDPRGRFRKELLAYHDLHSFGSKMVAANAELVIALGAADLLTLWKIVSVEKVFSGQDLLALKARSSFGVLPEVDFSKVPAGSKEAVAAALTKLRTSAYGEQASSVVEQCRPGAQVSFAASHHRQLSGSSIPSFCRPVSERS